MTKKIDDIEEKKILESFRKAAENDRRANNELKKSPWKKVKDEQISEVENTWNCIIYEYDTRDVTRVVPQIMETLATYTNYRGEICQDSKAIQELWKKIPLDMKNETILGVVRILSIWVGKAEIREGEDNIGCLFKNLDTTVIDKNFLDILNYFVNTTYENEYHRQCAQTINLVCYYAHMPKTIREKYYVDICKIALRFKGNDISTILISLLPEFKDLSKDIQTKIMEQNLIVKTDFKGLEQIDIRDILMKKHFPICLVGKDASEMSLQQIENLEREGFNIQYVKLNDNVDGTGQSCMSCYNITQYKKDRTKIDTLLEEVDINGEEIKIFMQIVHVISKSVIYDMSAVQECQSEKAVSSRNLTSLLHGMTVCAGFSEIVRNMAACRGIEVIIVYGDGHTWNQVNLKLNGKRDWFNFDLTEEYPQLKDLDVPSLHFLSNNYMFQLDYSSGETITYHIPANTRLCHECESMPREKLASIMREMVATRVENGHVIQNPEKVAEWTIRRYRSIYSNIQFKHISRRKWKNYTSRQKYWSNMEKIR